jgi:hypothetical protein
MQSSQRILAVFRDIDAILTKSEEMIVSSRAHSPFNNYLTQLSAEQNKCVDRAIGELRTAMICVLRKHGVVSNDPHINTAWAVRQTLASAASRFDELMEERSNIGADGSEDSDEETAKLILQMRNAFAHMDRCLSLSEPTLAER